MRKIEIFTKSSLWIFFFLVLFSGELFSLPMGDPAIPVSLKEGCLISRPFFLKAKVGYEGDIIFDRKLRMERDSIQGKVDEFYALWNQAVFAVTFFHQAEVYGLVGAMSAKSSNRVGEEKLQRKFQTSRDLAYGVGGRIILCKFKKCFLGLDAKWQAADPKVVKSSLEEAAFSSSGALHYEEWQVGLGLSYETGLFFPYAGFTYSKARVLVKDVSPRLHLEVADFSMVSRQKLGLALGVTMTQGKDFALNFETELFSEEGITVSAQLLF